MAADDILDLRARIEAEQARRALYTLTPLAASILREVAKYGINSPTVWDRILFLAYDKPQRKRTAVEKRELETQARAALAELQLLGLVGRWRDNIDWGGDVESYAPTEWGVKVFRATR